MYGKVLTLLHMQIVEDGGHSDLRERIGERRPDDHITAMPTPQFINVKQC